MVAAAADLLHRRGFQATGVAEVIKQSGAPRGSFYHHFPEGKNQLAIEAVEWARHRVLGYFGAKMSEAPSGREAVSFLLNAYIDQLEETEFKLGCPFAISGLESVAGHEPIRAACATALLDIQNLIEKHLARDIGDEKAKELAPVIFAAYEGAFLVSQMTNDVSTLRAVHHSLPKLMSL
jgi:TetR/AcrR family transcriptional repressor of lmrAB and yxaGH operons